MSDTFRDFSGRNVFQIARFVRPPTLAQLRQEILRAERDGLGVSAVGSAWAFSAPGYNPGVVVQTDDLVGFPAWLQECVTQPSGGPEIWAAVAAGTKVRDLYRALWGRPFDDPDVLLQGLPGDPRVSPPAFLRGRQLAPPTLGGAGGQSIAGVISTGTHGGDANRPPIGDFVRAAVVVGSGGRVRVVQRPFQRAIDVARLNTLHSAETGGVEFEEYAVEGGLEAVTTSVGRIGVVFAYVYAVEDLSGKLVYEWRYEDHWSHVKAQLDSGELVGRARSRDEFLQVVMSPLRAAEEDRTCYVTRHRTDRADLGAFAWRSFEPEARLGLPDAVEPIDVMPLRAASPMALVTQIFAVDQVTPVIVALQWVLRRIAIEIELQAAIWGGPIGAIAAIPLVVEIVDLADDLGTIGRGRLFGDVVAEHLNHLETGPYSFITTSVIGAILGSAQSGSAHRPGEPADSPSQPWLVRGPRGFVLDTFEYHQPPLFRGDSIEVFFAADGTLTGKVQLLLDAFGDMQDRGVPVASYISLRFLSMSHAHLAVTHPDPALASCAVEVSLLRGMRGNDEALAAVKDIAISNDGRVHWGQQNTLTDGQVRAAFSSLPTWKARLADLESTSMTFLTPFAQSHGLDVDRPEAWDGWQGLGLTAGGDPCVVSDGARYLVLACDPGGILQVNSQDQNAVGTSWSRVCGRPFATDCAPTALLRHDDGRLEVLAVTATSEVGHVWQEGTDGLRFSDLSVKTAPWGHRQLVGRAEIASVQFTNGTMRVFAVEVGGSSRLLQSGLDFLETLIPVDDQSVTDRIAAAEWAPAWARPRNDPLLVAFASGDRTPIWRTYGHGPWSAFPPLPGRAGILEAALLPGTIVASTTAGLFALPDSTPGEPRPTYAGPWQPLPPCPVEPVAVDNPLGWCQAPGGSWLLARGRSGQLLTIQHLDEAHWGAWTALGGRLRPGSRPAGGLLPDGRVQAVLRVGASDDPTRADLLFARRQRSPGVW